MHRALFATTCRTLSLSLSLSLSGLAPWLSAPCGHTAKSLRSLTATITPTIRFIRN